MNYWEAREQQRITSRGIKETEEQIANYYLNAMKKICEQFEATYNKVLLSTEEGRAPTPADLYKLGKYWEMQGALQKELQNLGDKQHEILSKQFQQQFINIYNALAIKDSQQFNSLDKQVIEQMINNVWCADGKSWSNRIWGNTEQLRETLNENLIHCLLTGKKTSELKKILMQSFEVSFNRADTIVRTEMAHIQTEAAKKRYQDYGIQEVEVWADEDERRCEHCGQLHQKRIPIHGQMPIPAHPNCRCCIIPVIESK